MYQDFKKIDIIYIISNQYGWEKDRQIFYIKKIGFGKIKAIYYINS